MNLDDYEELSANDALQITLLVAKHLAPNKEVVEALDKMVSQMTRDGFFTQDIILALCGAIKDGIAYGNWLK